MARAKTTKKKAATTKRSSSKKTFNLAGWLSANRMWLFVVVFAVVGTYFLVTTFANPKLPTYSDDIVAGYIDMKPITMHRDSVDGPTTYESYPASTYLLRDGTLVCDDGNSTGEVKTTVLSNKQVAGLHRELHGNGFTKLPDNNPNAADNGNIVTYEGFLLGSDGTSKTVAVSKGAKKPDAFTKSQTALLNLCAQATETTDREKSKKPRQPMARVNSPIAPDVITSIREFIMPVASAANSPSASRSAGVPCCGSTKWETTVEQDQVNRMNASRAALGIPALKFIDCTRQSARSVVNANMRAGYIYHVLTWSMLQQYCSGLNWNNAGENVGVGYDSAGLYKAFYDSTAHRNNMLSRNFQLVGVGAAKTPDGRLWVTHHFGGIIQ